MPFTFIDLFAGIGGTRLAFERAGGLCVFSSEIDCYARRTYSANFGDVPAGDLMKVREDLIPDHDILVAGFPCQPFSLAGVSKRKSLGMPHGFECKKEGHLFFKLVEILRKKKPNAFLLENVKHLKSHAGGETYSVICSTLENAGYVVTSELIDSRRLVPQHRERIYIVGFRKDLGIKFDFPTIPDLAPRLTDILQTDVSSKYTLSDKLWNYLRAYAKKQRSKGNGFGYGLVDPSGIARTLSARYYKDGAEILVPQKRRNPRRLTPRECACLMGFPPTFVIPVSDTQAYKQFGNSVAVPIVERIAQQMASYLGDHPQIPKV
jgi:DNA (cytosine-5)-methyltransferase 1